MKRISKVVVLCMAIAVALPGCNIHSEKCEEQVTDIKQVDKTVDADKIEVISAGKSKVYLDEVRYYAYNTQATYEAYYIAEGKELDWDKEMSVGVSLEKAVKSTVFDSICEREAIVLYADEYQIILNEADVAEVEKKVQAFFEGTNKKLLRKINVTRERLTEIYQKDALFKKVKATMEEQYEGKSEAAYKKWKTVNNVTTNEYWEGINYKEPIFMK